VNRDEAFQLLGLYLGASGEMIAQKHRDKRAALEARLPAPDGSSRAALQTEIARLDLALEIATGKSPEHSAPTQLDGVALARAPRKRGKLVLLALLIGLVMFAVTGRVAMYLFDPAKSEPTAPLSTEEAERASVAWLTYISRSGRPDTASGREAATQLGQAAGAREAGNPELAQRKYNEAWQAFFNAFKEEGAAAGADWQKEVATPWHDKLQGRFPFDPKAGPAADVAAVAQLFNPVDGTAWKYQRRFDALAEVELKGTRFFALPAGYAEFLRTAQGLRDALFAGQGRQIQVPFAARIHPGRLWGKITLEIGNKECTSNRRGEWTPMVWNGDDGGCILKAGPLDDRKDPTRSVDATGNPWGLLKILGTCKPLESTGPEQNWAIEDFDLGKGPGAKADPPSIQILQDRKPSPFDFATYEAVKLP